MKEQCKLCGSITGLHGFSFNKDGQYTDKSRSLSLGGETMSETRTYQAFLTTISFELEDVDNV